jgi:beta-lactamase regulating signal transducer with metallopeptidase domain
MTMHTFLRELSGFGLTWLVQSSVLLTLGLLAGWLFRRSGPAMQSCVYRTTLAAVLVCPFASAVLGIAGFAGFSWRLPAPISQAPTVPVAPFAAATPETFDMAAHSNTPNRAPRETASVVISTPMRQPEVVPAAPALVAPPSFRVTTTAIAAIGLALWSLGSTLMAVRLLVGQARMRLLRASAAPAERETAALCREIARKLNVGSPTVWRSPFLFGPCLDGLRHPAILLPEDVGTNLRETLIHELAHLARHDGLWNLIRRWATAGFWFQPLLWVLSRRLEAAAEEVCDDYVVHWGAERADYAGHLLELARRALPPAAPASVGMVSLRSMLARRVVRILDTSRSLSTRAGRRSVLTMVAVGLAGTVFAGLLGVNRRTRADDPKRDQIDEEKAIHGMVVAPDGKPIAGATVILSRRQRISNGIGDGWASKRKSETFRKTTATDGRFTFAPETFGQVIATAPGFGVGHLSEDETIRLTAGDRPINGRLVDLEGRPVPGVKVTLEQVWLPSADAQDSPDTPFTMNGRLGLDAFSLLPDGLVTGPDGRFLIEGLGRDVVADVKLTGPTIAHKTLRIVTRNMGRIVTESSDSIGGGLADPATYGATCTIAVERTRAIEGFVRDAQTNQPIPGATVTGAILSGTNMVIDGLISTESDAQGHYRLTGLPKEGATGHKLAVYPPIDRPYFITGQIEAPATPGYEPSKVDVALKSGIWITGQVTDSVTGKPVAAAAVDYFPLLTNYRAESYANFNPLFTQSIGIKTRYKTDANGRFRIVGLPGDGVVTVHAEDKSYLGGVGAESIKGRTERGELLTYDRIEPNRYQSLKQISVPEGATSFACDLGINPGGSVRLRLIDESGSPVTDTVVFGQFPAGNDDGDHGIYTENIARIVGLEPGKPRTVLIQHEDRKIGAVLTIPPDGPRHDSEITVTLRPCGTLSGRIVDGDGKPARGNINIELTPAEPTRFGNLNAATTALDAAGRFRCDAVPAGSPYHVSAITSAPDALRGRMQAEESKLLAQDLKLEAGQTLDLGTFDAATGRHKDDPPAAKGADAGVPITGRIVNLEGQPVAGVLVKVDSVLVPKSDDLTPWILCVKGGEPPWVASKHLDGDKKDPELTRPEATTDQGGRFQLEGFRPDRVVELELRGGMIAHTTIDVVTRRIGPFSATGYSSMYSPGNQTIFGAEFTYTATPGRLIEGVVKDAKTGQGLANTEIRSNRFAGTNYIGVMTLRTKTDRQGRFRLAGMPKGKGNQIIIVPNDEQPYFMQELKVPDPPGAGPVEVSLALERGIWIEGKVTEKATGMALPIVRLHYFPFLENKFAQAHPVFHSSGSADGLGFQDRYVTKPDGTFRLVGLPGRAIVGAIIQADKPYLAGAGSEAIKGMNSAGHFETYRNPVNPSKLWPTVMKEINPPADATVAHVDLQVTTGPSVSLTVVDPAGEPIRGLHTNGRFGRSSYDRDEMTKPDAEVLNLMPDEERIVLLRHEGRKLGKVVMLKKGDDARGPVVVKLAPLAAITGRVVDDDGNPIPGVRIRPDVLPHGDFGLSLPPVVTGADGRFRVSDAPAGCDYGLSIEASAPTNRSRYGYHSRAEVKPGETTDIGEFKFK